MTSNFTLPVLDGVEAEKVLKFESVPAYFQLQLAFL